MPAERVVAGRPLVDAQLPNVLGWLKHAVRVVTGGGDTVIGAGHKQAIVTLVERKGGFMVFSQVARKTSDLVSRAISASLELLAARVKKVTYDNRKEFANHVLLNNALKSTAYFSDLFASWQRGSNENFNGLIMPIHPSKTTLNAHDCR